MPTGLILSPQVPRLGQTSGSSRSARNEGTRPVRAAHDPRGFARRRDPAPRGSDPEVHLHTELGEEAKRLATHPREEAHRLSEELKAGEVETTPLIALTGIGIALGLFIALVIALVFVVAYLI